MDNLCHHYFNSKSTNIHKTEVKTINTLSHLGLAVAVLGKERTNRAMFVVVAGALVPDILMFVFVAIDRLQGYSFQDIFDVNYFTPRWQVPLNITNSIPVFAGLAGLAYWRKWDGLWLFSLAALLHIAFDLPIHHDDAHAHFWPLSDWKFISPVSYWDRAHHAAWWSPIELMIVVASTYFGAKWIEGKGWRIAFLILMGLCFIMQAGLFYSHWFTS